MKWWAYLHTNGRIQVKRWHPAPKGFLDDLQSLQSGIALGFELFVKRAVEKPFIARDREDAIYVATQLLMTEITHER